LSPALRRGDIVAEGELACDRPFHRGALVCQDRVAVTAAEKHALAARGIAVEMESDGVRQTAREHGVPFFAVKVVSDTADETLPLDFNRYRGPGGEFQRGRIAMAAAARPWTWPGLIRMGHHARDCAEKLGDFLARCRF
jgi:adenosylhomocysteine nucleosidase